jgi:hypothetical protein
MTSLPNSIANVEFYLAFKFGGRAYAIFDWRTDLYPNQYNSKMHPSRFYYQRYADFKKLCGALPEHF